jgi:hypothetical protein
MPGIRSLAIITCAILAGLSCRKDPDLVPQPPDYREKWVGTYVVKEHSDHDSYDREWTVDTVITVVLRYGPESYQLIVDNFNSPYGYGSYLFSVNKDGDASKSAYYNFKLWPDSFYYKDYFYNTSSRNLHFSATYHGIRKK